MTSSMLQINIKNLYCYTCCQFYEDPETFKMHHTSAHNSNYQDNEDDDDVKIESITDEELSDYENKASIEKDFDYASSSQPQEHQRQRIRRNCTTRIQQPKIINYVQRQNSSIQRKPLQLSMYRDYLHCYKCCATFYKFPELTAHFRSCEIPTATNFTFTDFGVWRRSEKISTSSLTSTTELDNYENESDNIFGSIIMGNSSRWKSADEIEINIPHQDLKQEQVKEQEQKEEEKEKESHLIPHLNSPSPSEIIQVDDDFFSSSENDNKNNSDNDDDEIFEPPSPASSTVSSSSSSISSIASNYSETETKKPKKIKMSRNKKLQPPPQQKQVKTGQTEQESTAVKKPVEKTFLCTYCPKVYSTRSKLQYHINSHEGIKPFKCTFQGCEMSFHGRKNLYRHLGVHKKNELKSKDNAKVKAKSEQEKNPSLITARKIYPCVAEGCNKVFKDSKGLRQHEDSHLPKTLPCPVPDCGRFFATKKRLEIHDKAFHQKDRKHMCEICGASFYQHFSMVLHKRCHLGIKNHVCDVCGVAFTQPTMLKRHLWVHSGTKNYECREGCDRRFRTSGQRKRHEQTHTKFNPYKCAFCPVTFSDNRALKKHLVNQHIGEHDFDLNIPSTYQGG